MITPQKYEREVRNMLKNQHVTRTIHNLDLVTVRLPEESLDIPGVYYTVLQALARKGINFIEIISIATELSILIENTESYKTFEILKKLSKSV